MKKTWSILVAIVIVFGAIFGINKCNTTSNKEVNDSTKIEKIDSIATMDSVVTDSIIVDSIMKDTIKK